MDDSQRKDRDIIRAKLPGLAKSAESGSRAAAIKLFCIECMGGSRSEASQCAQADCFLWGFAYPEERRSLADRLAPQYPKKG